MKILVFGATGMLGHKLLQTLSGPFEVWGTVRSTYATALDGIFRLDRIVPGVAANDLASVERTLDAVQPDAAINCIGIIKQQELANNPLACLEINAQFPHRLAAICRLRGVRLVQISTDCVFSGTKGNYRESDMPDARDIYGRSKALGELLYPGTITLRTSIIGRELNSRLGLVEWFLSQTDSVKGYTQARFSGVTTAELSRTIRTVLLGHPELAGLYQVASEAIDKASLLRLLAEAYSHRIPIVPNGDLRIDRSLNGTKFETATGYRAPSWREMVQEMASDTTSYSRLEATIDTCR